MSQNSYSAYTTHQRSDETIRETEAHALLSCASRLEAVREPTSSREDFFAALRHNQELWTVLQVCLCEPDNLLPMDIKGILLNLSRYVDKTTFRALADGNRAALGSLININRNIAAGLQKKQEQEKIVRPLAAVPAEEMRPRSVMTSA
ncbi:MAG: flagellar biosynthesis regulator FlaF [Bdellovibrionales bacterium]|jgi:flagellar protein FlaF